MPTARPPSGPLSNSDGTEPRSPRLAEEIFSRHGSRLRAIAHSNGPREDDPEDAVQTAFTQFLEHFRGPEDLALPWLITTLKRTSWRQGRARRRRPTTSFVELATNHPAGDEADQFEGDASDPADLVVRGDEVDRQRAALLALPREQRIALVYTALELSHEEISELTGWSSRQIRRYVQKGNAALQAGDEEGA